MNNFSFSPPQDVHRRYAASQRALDRRTRVAGKGKSIVSRANPWQPFTLKRLPGVQVVITAHDAEPWLERCLASVEIALRKFRWVLILVDDGSTDQTLKIAVNHKTSADRVIIRSFPKADNVSIAKNRAFAQARGFAKEYPAIVAMDADDEMTPDRVSHLLPAAVQGGHLAVMGDYVYVCPEIPERHDVIVPARIENITEGKFGPPMTLFHASLIPYNGLLFREEMRAFSDCALWTEWRQRGIEVQPVPGRVVHRYHYREGSTSNPRDKEQRRRNINHHHEVQRRILANHAEPATPRVSALMLTGKCVERYALAHVAVACFQRQTWPNKELIIVNHGPVSLANGDPNIREIRVHRTPEMTLGDLRNLSRAHATGEYVIQWDDDDYHHARRIETMMEHRDKAEVVTIGWQIRFNIVSGCAFYHALPGGQQMSILHRANAPFRYPKLDAREDTIFINQFNSKCVIDNDPEDGLGPLLYVRLFHNRNIWHEGHVMEHLAGKRDVMEVNPAHVRKLAAIKAEYFAAPGFTLGAA